MCLFPSHATSCNRACCSCCGSMPTTATSWSSRLGPMHEGETDSGGVYRALRGLERRGLVRSEWCTSGTGPARRTYHLTSDGATFLDAQASELQQVTSVLQRFLDRYARCDAAMPMSGRTTRTPATGRPASPAPTRRCWSPWSAAGRRAGRRGHRGRTAGAGQRGAGRRPGRRADTGARRGGDREAGAGGRILRCPTRGRPSCSAGPSGSAGWCRAWASARTCTRWRPGWGWPVSSATTSAGWSSRPRATPWPWTRC